jgi:hypothetical protein
MHASFAQIYVFVPDFLKTQPGCRHYLKQQQWFRSTLKAAEADRWKARIQDQFPADGMRSRLLERENLAY